MKSYGQTQYIVYLLNIGRYIEHWVGTQKTKGVSASLAGTSHANTSTMWTRSGISRKGATFNIFFIFQIGTIHMHSRFKAPSDFLKLL